MTNTGWSPVKTVNRLPQVSGFGKLMRSLLAGSVQHVYSVLVLIALAQMCELRQTAPPPPPGARFLLLQYEQLPGQIT